jgi:alkylhydroperoxidase family enzyme
LAQKNGCVYCQAKGKPDPAIPDEKTAVATGFSNVFLTQKGDIPDSVFNVLKDTCSDEEISEIMAFITFTTAQCDHAIGRVTMCLGGRQRMCYSFFNP